MVEAVATDAVLRPIYLVEIEAGQPGGTSTTGRTDFGDLAWGELAPDPTIATGAAVYRFSTAPFNTAPDDDPPNRPYLPRLTQALTLQRDVGIAPGEGGVIGLDKGEIQIENADRALDELVLNYAVDGRPVTVRRVQPGQTLAEAVTVYTGYAQGWKLANNSRALLSLRSALYRLRVMLQSNLYAGTGNKEGGADLANKRKPLCYGKPYNVPCTLLDLTLLLYQVHDGSVENIPEVFDGGVVLTQGADHATYADLVNPSNDPAGGTYSTCLAEGLFRLGTQPVYPVTANVWGDNTGGTHWLTTADIVRRFLLDRLGFSSGDLVGADFDALAAAVDAPVDFYLGVDDPVLAIDAIAVFMAGIGAWLGDTPLGKFTCGRIRMPDGSGNIGNLTELSMLDIQLIELPDPINPAIWRIGVEYARAWTVQTLAIDSINITEAQRNFVAQEARLALAANPDIKAFNLLARDHPPVASFFHEEADAQEFADYLLAAFSITRRLGDIPLKATGLDVDIDDEVTLVTGRFGMAGGRSAVVFGHGFDAAANLLTVRVVI